MSLELINQRLMQSVQVGIAIINPQNPTGPIGPLDPLGPVLVFANDSFKLWFKIEDEHSLGTFLDNGQIAEIVAEPPEVIPKNIEVNAKPKRRELFLSIDISHFDINGEPFLFIEVQNQTRKKELEAMINSYAKMMERNERELKREKERAEKLLLNIMPKSVLAELKEFGVTAPTKYEDASVVMLDFVSFTEMDIAADPAAVITELNDIFTNFDRIVEQFGCERIKTIGDAYMAVSGVPEADPDHARNIAKVALLMIHYLERRNNTHKTQWLARIGIASGQLIGSIVGIHKYVYDIFGPAVNLATRMEHSAQTMNIAVCSPMKEQIEGEFEVTFKSNEEIKGFGNTDIYTLDSIIGGSIN